MERLVNRCGQCGESLSKEDLISREGSVAYQQAKREALLAEDEYSRSKYRRNSRRINKPTVYRGLPICQACWDTVQDKEDGFDSE